MEPWDTKAGKGTCWMDGEQRRAAIARYLDKARGPVSAAALAREFSVSRQIIVGDVALLRAAGEQISATPRGYVLKQEQNLQTRTIACRHDDEHLLQELYIAVDNGCAVLDVTVEHPIYGQISGQLQVFSRYDADQFYHKLTTTNAPPLCALTGGVHLHTIQFQHEEDFERVVSRLREEGILFSE